MSGEELGSAGPNSRGSNPPPATRDRTADGGCPVTCGKELRFLAAGRRSLRYCVFWVGLEGHIDFGAWLQGDSVAGGRGHRVLDANLAEEIVGRCDGDFGSFRLAGDAGFDHLVDHRRHGRPRAISVPEELGMVGESTLLLAGKQVR